MKRWTFCILICLLAPLTAGAAAPGFDVYQVILDRQPFGVPPPEAPEPERVVPVHESFAAQMVLSGIFELEDGNLRVAVVDKKDNSYFTLKVGETGEGGIELLDVDYDEGEATLSKGEETVVLSMSGASGTQVLSSSEREDRLEQAKQRRLSYAERRRARAEARRQQAQQPPPKPVYTGEELEKHLQDYQMEVLRQGLPPLPVQLTPDRDAQLVAEGVLPPVDEEGYEFEYVDDPYYEEGY